MQQNVCGVSSSQFIQIVTDSDSYGHAAYQLGVHIKTVMSWAKKLGVSRAGNRGGGVKEPFDLQDILDGKHPQYPTVYLKKRLVQLGIKTNKCEECGITEWNGKPITIELDHVDGDRHNHRLCNLRMLCPNCHSQTNTYKSKNIGRANRVLSK